MNDERLFFSLRREMLSAVAFTFQTNALFTFLLTTEKKDVFFSSVNDGHHQCFSQVFQTIFLFNFQWFLHVFKDATRAETCVCETVRHASLLLGLPTRRGEGSRETSVLVERWPMLVNGGEEQPMRSIECCSVRFVCVIGEIEEGNGRIDSRRTEASRWNP